MKYMLMMNASAANWNVFNELSMDDIKAHVRFMGELNEELVAAGELIDAQGLAGPDEAIVVRANDDGSPAVTDGPFLEAKEFLAGFWIIECNKERAIEIATKISGCPGANGQKMYIPVEVRQVMSEPPAELSEVMGDPVAER